MIKFLKPRINARKCTCGEVIAFSVVKAMTFLGIPGSGEELRAHIRLSGIGCNGVKLSFADGGAFGSHVQRTHLPPDLLQKLDTGNYQKHFHAFISS